MNRATSPVRARAQRHSIPWWIARSVLYPFLWCIGAATRFYNHLWGTTYAYAWYDKRGVGFHEAPDWQAPTSPDKGQHEWAKRALRIWHFRIVSGASHEPGTFDLSRVGLGNESQQVPRLLPLGDDLAIACRSLGFARLMKAANRQILPHQIAWAHTIHEASVVEEAERRFALGMEVAARWDAQQMGYPYQCTSQETTVSMLTVGALDRPDLDACPPLRTLEEDML